jgi:DNA-directed RNA polymerase alpha subunit
MEILDPLFAAVPKPTSTMKTRKILACSIDELGLPKRTRNRLLSARIETIRDLLTLSRSDLLEYRYFGPAMVAELEEHLSRHNLKLKA